MSPSSNPCVMATIKSPARVALIWLGMTTGISLFASNQALSTTIRTTVISPIVEYSMLEALNKSEFVALIVLLILVRISSHTRDLLLPSVLVTLVLIAQATWVLPEFGSRLDLVENGSKAGGISTKSIYSFLELTKSFLLAYLGFRSLQLLRISNPIRE